MTETWLVTGGCGFIGSNFVRKTLEEKPGVSLINFDLLTYAGNAESLADVAGNPRYSFVRGDVADREAVEAVFARGVARVVHFAAESHVDRSIHDSGPFIRTNVAGTQTLLDAARRHGVAKFLLVSTDEVYGSVADGLFREDMQLNPSSPYAASKASADLLTLAAFKTFGLPVNVTRCSNNYGPYQFPEKLIPLFISNAMEGRPLPVYGDGGNVRDWIWVGDHVEALWAVLLEGAPGEIYNVGGGNERTNLDMTRMILKAVGAPDSLITYVKDRPGHDRRYAVDASKIARELGVKPKVGLDQGLAATVEWYGKNREWLDRVRSGEYRRFYDLHYGKGGG